MTDTTAYGGRSVLVTGASGILGSWLVRRLLEHGAAVVALFRDDNPDSELVRSGDIQHIRCVRGSLEDARLLDRTLVQYEVEVVFHLGAQTQVRHAQQQPFATCEANVRGTYNLVEAVRGATGRVKSVVVASSDKAYGESAELPYTEKHPLAARNIYDASKAAADLLSSAYAHSYGLPIGIARCGNIYGGGDLNWDRVVPSTIRSLLCGERPVIRSDGTPKRDYLFVEDAVSGYLALGAALLDGREHGEAFNFAPGEPVAVSDLVDRIARILGRVDLPPIILANAPNEIPAQWLDSTKARVRLSWEATVGLDDGLRQTADWYRRLLG